MGRTRLGSHPGGPSTNRYGGNTSCLQLTFSDGRLLVLDAGSGIRNDDEYPSHIGWGQSGLGDVLTFARLAEAHHLLLLFHHDPLHDDEQLDRLHAEALARWAAVGGSPHEVLIAAELQELELDNAGAGATGVAHAHRPRIRSCVL